MGNWKGASKVGSSVSDISPINWARAVLKVTIVACAAASRRVLCLINVLHSTLLSGPSIRKHSSSESQTARRS